MSIRSEGKICHSALPARCWPLVVLAAVAPARSAGEGPPAPAAAALGAVADAEATWGCPLFQVSPSSTTPMSTEEALARVGAIAAANAGEIERLDAGWRAGELGPPRSREADSAVHRLARGRLKNWYAFMLPLAGADEVRALEPSTVEELSARFCESTVFPTPRLRQLLAGRGWVCARYDLGGAEEEGLTLLGGKRSRYSVREARVGGRSRRVLAVEWRSASTGRVEIWLADDYGFRLQQQRVVDELGSYDLFLALDVSGAWVRRFGVHRPSGFAFWATRPVEGAGDTAALRVGSALYIPGLRLRLPLLPDIGFDDLRLLAPPVPLLPVEDVRRRALPEWLPTDRGVDLADWTRIGDLPAAVRDVFPDR